VLKASAQAASGPTKARIIEAALETLKNDGFSGASARTIARRGGFNQALVFYHFGSVTDLLLAALDDSSARRMAAYRAALEDVSDPEDLVATAFHLYREDLASGHITVVTEMIAGSLANPDLKAAIASRVDQWIDLAEAALGPALRATPITSIIPTRDLAYGIVAMYLGVELLSQLASDDDRVGGLFASAESAVSLLSGLFGGRP
jgi:AcrR family transcriptional regulator